MSQAAVHIEKLLFKRLDGFELKIQELLLEQSSRTFIEGASGSGKTTLLSLLCGVLRPSTTQKLEVLGAELNSLSNSELDSFRADHIGVIFQNFNLIPYLTVLENTLLTVNFSKRRKEKLGGMQAATQEALACLERLGLIQFLDRPVSKLSVGQRQRVAVARALLGSPELIIADEPTSALDTKNKDAFIELLLSEIDSSGASLIFVSHDPGLKSHFQKSISMQELVQC